MTEYQFQQRVIAAGGNEREAELISARVYPEWRKYPATKVTTEQKEWLATLLADQREEDELNARIDNDHINQKHAAGYIVRDVCFSGRA